MPWEVEDQFLSIAHNFSLVAMKPHILEATAIQVSW